MKMKELLLACLMGMHPFALAQAQGTFQNLGFESASLVAIPGDSYQRVQFDSAFPGWVGYVGGVQQISAQSNSYFLDSSGFVIIDNGWPHYFGETAGVVPGMSSALLQAGWALGTTTPADTTLTQSSLVSVNAESLRFRAYTVTGFYPIRLFLGGVRLSLTQLAVGTNYILFGADIHSWQGQMAQLDFTLLAQQPHQGNNYLFLDSFEFSTQPIPEPSVFALLGLGVLLIGGRLFSKSRL